MFTKLYRKDVSIRNFSYGVGVLSIVLLASFAIGSLIALASPPSSKYAPGETLNPTCGPDDTNCTVDISSSSSGGWIDSDSFIYPNNGNTVAAPYIQATSTSATSTFSGGLTIDTNDLLVDSGGHRVGIGTSSPSYR